MASAPADLRSKASQHPGELWSAVIRAHPALSMQLKHTVLRVTGAPIPQRYQGHGAGRTLAPGMQRPVAWLTTPG